MRLFADDAWPLTHFAFEADPAACRALAEALARSSERAAEAYRARAAQKPPDGWAPAEEGGYFVRVAEDPPAPSAEDEAAELEAFLDRHDLAHQHAAVAARRAIPTAEREKARAQLEAILDEPVLARLSVLLGAAPELPPLFFRDLVFPLDRLTTLRRLKAPDVIVEHERDRVAACAERLLAVAEGRASEAAVSRGRSAREGDLFDACLEICLGPAPEDVGIGGCLDDRALEGEGDWLGEGVCVVGADDLTRFAATLRDTPLDLDAYRDQAEDELLSDAGHRARGEAAIEARATELRDAHAARLARLATRAEDIARRGRALVTIVREAPR